MGCQNFVANDEYIVVCLSDATVHVLSSTTGALLQETPFVHSAGYVTRPILDGDTAILCSPNGVTLTVYSIPQHDVAFFRTVLGKTLVTSSPDGTMVTSNWETGAVLWKKTLGEPYNPSRRKEKPTGVAAFALAAYGNNDNNRIAAGGTDGRLFVFDLETGAQLKEWQAADSMTQHLLVRGDQLIQLSWGEMKIWSLADYSLVQTVRMFDRVATSVALHRQSVICCGRDAATGGDMCGLDVGIKGWTAGKEQVFNIGPRLRNAGGLQILSGDRLVLNVLRGRAWSVEIWSISE
ncbi:hypothetical protein SCUCBS95973_007733 [Sporothrix curviconia]|uniref:Pyrrolo-quinoline quinone repeat domain-containing protein n=1 Tax=Sporothrix curviconia TaxID=1260050 RepID=A0ABP0CFT7_9PEZI